MPNGSSREFSPICGMKSRAGSLAACSAGWSLGERYDAREQHVRLVRIRRVACGMIRPVASTMNAISEKLRFSRTSAASHGYTNDYYFQQSGTILRSSRQPLDYLYAMGRQFPDRDCKYGSRIWLNQANLGEGRKLCVSGRQSSGAGSSGERLAVFRCAAHLVTCDLCTNGMQIRSQAGTTLFLAWILTQPPFRAFVWGILL